MKFFKSFISWSHCRNNLLLLFSCLNLINHSLNILQMTVSCFQTFVDCFFSSENFERFIFLSFWQALFSLAFHNFILCISPYLRASKLVTLFFEPKNGLQKVYSNFPVIERSFLQTKVFLIKFLKPFLSISVTLDLGLLLPNRFPIPNRCLKDNI